MEQSNVQSPKNNEQRIMDDFFQNLNFLSLYQDYSHLVLPLPPTGKANRMRGTTEHVWIQNSFKTLDFSHSWMDLLLNLHSRSCSFEKEYLKQRYGTRVCITSTRMQNSGSKKVRINEPFKKCQTWLIFFLLTENRLLKRSTMTIIFISAKN
jgi:hypothetical protein